MKPCHKGWVEWEGRGRREGRGGREGRGSREGERCEGPELRGNAGGRGGHSPFGMMWAGVRGTWASAGEVSGAGP